MATYLSKPVRRAVVIGDREWVVSMLPPDDVHRFPRVEFRQKRSRRIRYWLPMEAARNDAARRWDELARKERAKRRKEKRQGLLASYSPA